MKQVLAKGQIERELTSRFGAVFKIGEKPSAHFLSSGVPEIDTLTGGGMPRGAITEICGPTSSGRISTLVAALACATGNNEICAVVDTMDSFDLASASNAGVDLNRLLWVRCSSNLERAFKATDLLLQSGGFGLVALNLADVKARYTRRIMSSWWFRFRGAIENTPTALVVVTPVACIRSSAALVLELKTEDTVWPSTLSLVLGNGDARLTIKEDKEYSTRRLSLVTAPTQQPGIYFTPLSHSHLLQGIRIRVNRERPLAWPGKPARFDTRLH